MKPAPTQLSALLGFIALTLGVMGPSARADQAAGAMIAQALPQAKALERDLPWQLLPEGEAWQNLLNAPPEKRHSARWLFALSLLNSGKGPDALGMLDLLVQADPALDGIANYRLARGAALTLMGRHADAVTALDHVQLAAMPDACAWRMRALADAGLSKEALRQSACALPVLKRLSETQRVPFIEALSAAAVEEAQYKFALEWLDLLPATPATSLLKARALYGLKQDAQAQEFLAEVDRSGTEGEKAAAGIARIEAKLARQQIAPAQAIKELDKVSYAWRGDRIELKALKLRYRLARDRNDGKAALVTGATMIRYFDWRLLDPALLPELRLTLSAILDPASGTRLDQAAGVYWDYRDLAPAGAEGELLIMKLAGRLEEAGLYARAGELLEHRLKANPNDETNGSVSVRAATMFVKADQCDRAIRLLAASEGPAYLPEILTQRKQVEAVALARLGRASEALAVLEGAGDSELLKNEILWYAQKWDEFVVLHAASLPAPHALSPTDRIRVLRQAIALTLVKNQPAALQLRQRYLAAFKGSSEYKAFELLTGPVGRLDPVALGNAIAATTTSSPAGALGDLLLTVPAPVGNAAKAVR